MAEEIYDDDILESNLEIEEDIEGFNPRDIVVYSRDWTIETIFAQIIQGNIDLNPKFQRRNAWTDEKRSTLIESILIGYPIPEIVLAEDPKKKKAFIVIDGKQRLLTIAGFIDNATFQYWSNPRMKNLIIKKNLEKVSFEELKNNPDYSDEYREFMNSSLRCTVITNFEKNDVLYDIFYRLNSGSTPLSTQELRQVLNRGEFANYLITITDTLQPIHTVLNLTGPDKRLKDIEIILRLFTFTLYPNEYNGNLKVFLDNRMGQITQNWDEVKDTIKNQYLRINDAISKLNEILGSFNKIGRKMTGDRFEGRFNRVLFEVQIFYQLHLERHIIDDNIKTQYLENFILLCEDPEFRGSIESSTKNMESYRIRYKRYESFINTIFDTDFDINPFKIISP
jgi:uncharacterized protein with ParB-like and HNH nuclease domain